MSRQGNGGSGPAGHAPDEVLPAELERLVETVMDASGLPPRDRAEVEAELRDHFRSGLAGGRTRDQLAGAFGDPEAAGRRIGRSRKGRPRRTRGTGEEGWTMRLGTVVRMAKQAARRLARAPGYVALVVLTLALGVGANTAIFSVLHAVLLEDLPYPEPERLVRVYSAPPENPENFNYLRAPTVAAYRSWTEIFEDFGALYTYREQGVDLTDGDRPVRLTAVPVTEGYFETLGVAPLLGRTFTEAETFAPEDDEALTRQTSTAVVVLSNHLWEEHFQADPEAVGRTLRLDDVTYRVVGVLPAGFEAPFGPEADLWMPQNLTPELDNWGNYYLSGVARLAPGVELEQAQDRMTALYHGLAQANPDAGEWSPRLRPLHADLVGDTRRTMLWILAGAAGLVLLTACLNVANLVLARGLTRHRDVAVRAALGSGRRRLVAHILAEQGLLATLGGGLGLVFGWAGVRGLMALAPDALPRITAPELGTSVFLFALAVTGGALLVFGLAPAWRLSRASPAQLLRAGDRSSTGARGSGRIRDGLVVAQVAAALVLVTGGVLLARSFASLRDVPLSVQPEGVLTYEVHLPGARYPEGADRQTFHDRLRERTEALPGVASAGAVSWLPMNGRYHIWGVFVDPDALDGPGEGAGGWTSSDMRFFTGDYFASVGLEVLRGRTPEEVDLEAEPVAWLSAGLADEVFGGLDPVGRLVQAAGTPRRIAGVVEDVPVDARGRVTPHTYIPHEQFSENRNWALIQTVKAQGDASTLLPELRRVLGELDPQLVLYRPRSLDRVVGAARAQDRFATLLMGVFAGLGLILSLVGTYGVLASSVVSRRREIGIRMALGAEPVRVQGMVLRYAATLVVPGIVLGLAGALAGAGTLEGLLFQVEGADPVSYLVTAGLVLVVGGVAAWLPAHRATRVDTVQVLSVE